MRRPEYSLLYHASGGHGNDVGPGDWSTLHTEPVAFSRTATPVMTAPTAGRGGLSEWAGRLNKWRVSWRWYVGVLISVPVVLTLTTVAVTDQNPVTPSIAVMVAYLPGLILQMLTTGIAEEPGWRDF